MDALSTILIVIIFKVDEVQVLRWKAYPRYSTAERYDKFKLDDGLYHVNAMEWAASAMEMSVISGRNAAILAFNDYQEKCSDYTLDNQA